MVVCRISLGKHTRLEQVPSIAQGGVTQVNHMHILQGRNYNSVVSTYQRSAAMHEDSVTMRNVWDQLLSI